MCTFGLIPREGAPPNPDHPTRVECPVVITHRESLGCAYMFVTFSSHGDGRGHSKCSIRNQFFGLSQKPKCAQQPNAGLPNRAYQLLVGGVRHAASCILVSMQPSCILLSPQTTHTPPTARVLGTDSQTDSSWR